MSAPNKILQKMLDRLLAALVNGPSLNCRPYASRQRLDVVQLGKLGDAPPHEVIRGLLGPSHEVVIKAKTPMPKGEEWQTQKLKVAVSIESADENGMPLADAPAPPTSGGEERSPERAWAEQQAVLNKLHTIAEDARTYEQDTGVSVLNVGFPLLSLPPGTFGGGGSTATRRVLAPLAFVPISITVKRGASPAIELGCKEHGVDLVLPNTALFAWLEQQTGKPLIESDEDEEGAHPWQEICEIVRTVCGAMDITLPEIFRMPEDGRDPARPPGDAGDGSSTPFAAAGGQSLSPSPGTPGEGRGGGFVPPAEDPHPNPPPEYRERGRIEEKPQAAGENGHPSSAAQTSAAAAAPVPIPAALELHPAPRGDDVDDKPRILCSAVLGLFPMANQGLLRDTQAMIATDKLGGPVESFIRQDVSLDLPLPTAAPQANATEPPPSIAPARNRPAVLIAEERFVSGSDPCQARAVRLARESRGLVVHGPPGTGKSQTITNIIGDHLARGQRVLVVCDKRTALDVVFNRLSHMGLGKLCALVHDPRRDQRELYLSIREQLDELESVHSDAKADAKLAKVDGELQQIHDELSRYRDALIRRPGESGMSFHDLVGQWLTLEGAESAEARVEDIPLSTLDTYAGAAADVLKRGEAVTYGVNPWASAAGIALGDFLAQSMNKIRAAAAECADTARAADATCDPVIPPFSVEAPLKDQAEARTALAENLPKAISATDAKIRARWSCEPLDGLAAARRKLDEAAAFSKTLAAGAIDGELLANVRNRDLAALPVAEHLLKLAAYEEFAKKWYSFLPLQPKSEGIAVLNSYGLPGGIENAQRVRTFLNALRARVELSALARSLGGLSQGSVLPDETIARALADHRRTIDLMLTVRNDAALAGLVERISAALVDPAAAAPLIEGLRKSPPRATALEKYEEGVARSKLFDARWLAQANAAARSGKNIAEIFSPLQARVDTLEGVLRIRQGMVVIPLKLRTAVEKLLAASVEPDRGMKILRREALAGEIAGRLKADPHLQEIDGHRLSEAFEQYRTLDEQKRSLARAAIQHRWISRQQERLLAQTGSRLNSLGADLRRRLMLRGERAMRLRQVIAVGSKIVGGDPLFDLCPIWLCSPETVAQIFPREAVFDVLVFDEASQLRLEESLPVLLRGKRVVIAGDPKQLPPTRFFESAVAASEEDDAQNDQELFEQHQGEIEDLLGAALGLDIQQCYLDVHYRSRHGDLIAFSNQFFYGSRLQPIPAPPTADKDAPPSVELENIAGTYERRRNEAEADRIVAIVKELLSRKDAPSIGIACFNLVQRDLVVEKLDELAAEDAAFAKRLEKARTRQGEGSFEGLFVKNLENVQGDERDYILISTTYGPDRAGKFYRRFGPLGRTGGGRRLNVLVTRAREKVHIVTSIPKEAYHILPEIEAGQTPGGTWLLLAYLKFADALRRVENGAVAVALSDSTPSPGTPGEGRGGGFAPPVDYPHPIPPPEYRERGPEVAQAKQDLSENAARFSPPQSPDASSITHALPADVRVLPTRSPSTFAAALAERLATDHGVGSDVHWGNEGFCIDLALRDPGDPGGITRGVLCDAARFAAADDPMQWDIFRTGILEAQGWKLHRVWTPHFFRDPDGVTRGLLRDLAASGDSEANNKKNSREPVQ